MENIINYPAKSFVERYNECVRTLYDISEKSVVPLKYRLFLDPNKDLEEQVKDAPKVVRKHNRVYELSCDMPFGETMFLNGRERIVVYLVYTLV